MTGRSTLPSRHCAVEFQALPSRIGQIRRIVAAQLRYWRLDPLIDPAALGLGELLANVHQHTGADKQCTVELVYLWERLTVSVRDHDPHLPQVRVADSLAGSGRGLALVAAVSASWGMRAHHDGSGKVVWFTLPAPPLAEMPGVAAVAGAASVAGASGVGGTAGVAAASGVASTTGVAAASGVADAPGVPGAASVTERHRAGSGDALTADPVTSPVTHC